MYKICNEIYLNEKSINDFEDIDILIPKKNETQECEEYRTQTLTIHASKIVKNGIDIIIEKNLNKYQFKFRKNIGTKEY